MALEMKVPTVGESITEVTLASWLVNDGDYVEMDQMLCELESDKATFEVPAEKAGVIKLIAEEGADLEIGASLCSIDTDAAPKDKTADAKETTSEKNNAPKEEKGETKSENTKGDSYAKGTPSPAAAKIMAENNVDASTVAGTGKDGRITKEDAANAGKNKDSNAAAKPATSPKPSISGNSREVNRKKMSKLRQTISKHLVNSKNSTAMLTTFNEVDLTEVLALRAKYKEQFKEKYGVSLGFMGFFMKASATALMEMPAVGAQLDGKEVIYHDFVDISIAVSTPKGLVVPVVRNV